MPCMSNWRMLSVVVATLVTSRLSLFTDAVICTSSIWRCSVSAGSWAAADSDRKRASMVIYLFTPQNYSINKQKTTPINEGCS